MIEVEVKARARDLGLVRTRLSDLGARLISREHHLDIYFAHPTRDFRETDEVLRLRIVNGEAVLTYKGPRQRVPEVKARRELSVRVEPWEDMVKILENLGFREIARVRKYREVYTWGIFTISLDEVENLGTFVEVESLTNDPELVEKLRRDMLELLEKLGISTSDVVEKTYLELLLEKYRSSDKT